MADTQDRDRPAPVALFVYRRPAHARQAVQSLLANAEAPRTQLVVFSDGPRKADTQGDVAQVRAYARGITGFAGVRVVERERNLGLAQSILAGVGEMLAEHGRVIVVEDDLVVSPFFLAYMNEGLRRYAGHERVASIHGYMYPSHVALPETFFLRGADCWGWATWDRAWRHLETDGRKLEAQLRGRGLAREFDLDGRYPFLRMLQAQIAGRNDSWAIRWHASTFLADMLTLYPGRSHVVNTGADGSGTHSRTRVSLGDEFADRPTQWTDIPLEPHPAGREAMADYLAGLRRRLWVGRVRRLLRLQAA